MTSLASVAWCVPGVSGFIAVRPVLRRSLLVYAGGWEKPEVLSRSPLGEWGRPSAERWLQGEYLGGDVRVSVVAADETRRPAGASTSPPPRRPLARTPLG